jgi:polyhydroxybutyrate depolymerase
MLAGLATSLAAQAQQWPTQPGSRTITYQTPWDGRTRQVRVHLPTGFSMTGGIVRPLVVALHGGGGSGPHFENSTGYDLKADAENFIVVFPTGTGNPRSWNASTECCGPANTNQVDDVRFLREMVLSLLGAYAIDPDKVYAVGFSNGAVMAWRLGCDAADLFDAIGMDAGDSTTLHPDGSPCDLRGNTVRIVNLHGENDPNMPYMGGQGMGLDQYIRQPVEDPNPDLHDGETDIGLWTRLNRCAFTPRGPVGDNRGLRQDYLLPHQRTAGGQL